MTKSEVRFDLHGTLRNIEIASERIGLILKCKGLEAVPAAFVAELVNQQAAYISKCCTFIATSIASGIGALPDAEREAPRA